MLVALYWNQSITREVVIPPTRGTDNYSKTPAPDRAERHLRRTYPTTSSTTARERTPRSKARRSSSASDDLVLYRTTTAAAPRFVDVVKGQLSNGFLSPYTELDVWGPGGRSTSRSRSSRPSAQFPAATLFLGRQKFKIKAGASVRFACTSRRSPFVMTIRSLSEIPDEFNRPVIVKMTGLRAAPHRRPPRRSPAASGSRRNSMTPTSRASRSRAAVRAAATLALGGLCVGYILWKIDLGETAARPRARDTRYFLLARAITIWRSWSGRSLGAGSVSCARAASTSASAGCVRTSFTSYAVAQVLPDLARRRRDAHLSGTRAVTAGRRRRSSGRSCWSGSSAASATLAARGRRLRARDRALRRRRVPLDRSGDPRRARVDRRLRPLLAARTRRRSRARVPLLRRLRARAAARTVYDGLHGYRITRTAARRGHSRSRRSCRCSGCSASGSSASRSGVDLSPRPFFVLGPAPLPRDARPVHGQRARRPRGVLRQLPREAPRRRPTPRSRPGFLFYLLSVVERASPARDPALDRRGPGRRKDMGAEIRT